MKKIFKVMAKIIKVIIVLFIAYTFKLMLGVSIYLVIPITIIINWLTKTIESEREKYLKGFIKLGYGKRCKEYEEGCPTCDEWKLYDEYIK